MRLLDQDRVDKQYRWAWRYLPSRAGSNLASGLTLLDEQRKPGGTLETPRDENGCARARWTGHMTTARALLKKHV